jgi:hypothetical protein
MSTARTSPPAARRAWRAAACLVAAAVCVAPLAGPAHAAPARDTFAIGDSVMLGARSCLQADGITVDALGSRQISAGLATLRHRRTSLPARVVVHLGTNGGLDAVDLSVLRHVLRDVERIVIVTIQLPDDYSRYTFEDRTNDAIRAFAARYERVHLVEWNIRSDRQRGLLWSDHIHVTPRGCTVYARLVARALA